MSTAYRHRARAAAAAGPAQPGRLPTPADDSLPPAARTRRRTRRAERGAPDRRNRSPSASHRHAADLDSSTVLRAGAAPPDHRSFSEVYDAHRRPRPRPLRQFTTPTVGLGLDLFGPALYTRRRTRRAGRGAHDRRNRSPYASRRQAAGLDPSIALRAGAARPTARSAYPRRTCTASPPRALPIAIGPGPSLRPGPRSQHASSRRPTTRRRRRPGLADALSGRGATRTTAGTAPPTPAVGTLPAWTRRPFSGRARRRPTTGFFRSLRRPLSALASTSQNLAGPALGLADHHAESAAATPP